MGTHDSRQEYNEYMREYMRKRSQIRTIQAVQDLGGKCNTCGTKEKLTFLFVPQNENAIDKFSRILTYSKKRFEEEITNWELICKKCKQDKIAAFE